MTRYILGYESDWQETYDDEAEAIERAEEVATYGHTVEVVRRRFGFHSFVTGFPESEREALKARCARSPSGSTIPPVGATPTTTSTRSPTTVATGAASAAAMATVGVTAATDRPIKDLRV
jgi:hypothetical protein